MKKKIKSYSFLLTLLFASSCLLKKDFTEDKSGKYNVVIIKTAYNSEPVISGVLYNFYTNKPLGTNSSIQIDRVTQCHADVNGNFTFKTTPGNYKFTGAAMPYEFLTTRSIEVHNGDSVKLIIYLKPVTKPLID